MSTFSQQSSKVFRSCICCLSLLMLSLSGSVLSAEVEVLALFRDSAMLKIDGRNQLLKVGQTKGEVRLVSANSREAIVDIAGEEFRLGLSKKIASGYTEAQRREVRLSAGARGHYITPARINKRPTKVMIDTGATSVAMNQAMAKSLGVDFRKGRPTRVSTANGYADAYEVMLNSVTLGELTVHQVQALVTLSDFPQIILLGNSYLSRVNMFRENGVLVLQSH